MARFYYVVSDCETGTVALEGWLTNVEVGTQEQRVYSQCLKHLRNQRYSQLMAGYSGDIEDPEAVTQYVPAPFKNHVADFDNGIYCELWGNMASLWEVHQLYRIKTLQHHRSRSAELPHSPSDGTCDGVCMYCD